ncbi:hypothetical protein Golax_012433, partial [Gossypium laxum]|nr:hypothetical protein [Gossypium laxum]
DSRDEVWNLPWKCQSPQRCTVYKLVSENVIHAMRDCSAAKVTWCIWKNRNFLIFQRMPWSAEEIIKGSYSWGKQHVSFRKVNSIVRQVMRGEYNWIGECIIGLNRRLGKCSIFDAELQGILDGVSILQGKQCDRVLMQIDSLEIIEVIHESNS